VRGWRGSSSGLLDQNKELMDTGDLSEETFIIIKIETEIFYSSPPEMDEFHDALLKILDNIVEVKKIPIENRTHD